MFFAGVDIGSTMTKVVVLGEDASMVAWVVGPTGPEHRILAHRVMAEAIEKAGIAPEDVGYIIATGYGRINVPFADRQVTEISCHARGVHSLFPQARTVIDIGGQDCKGIKLANGRARDFVMNDKCAAGTGRFLEVIAEALGLRLEELGEVSLRATNPVKISSTCTVFAEQEVVSHLSVGVPVPDIVAGIHEAIATRVWAMVSKIRVEREVVITGGGAKNIGLVRALEAKLGVPVLVPPEPLLTGALGAAIIAGETARKNPLDVERLKERSKLLR